MLKSRGEFGITKNSSKNHIYGHNNFKRLHGKSRRKSKIKSVHIVGSIFSCIVIMDHFSDYASVPANNLKSRLCAGKHSKMYENLARSLDFRLLFSGNWSAFENLFEFFFFVQKDGTFLCICCRLHITSINQLVPYRLSFYPFYISSTFGYKLYY